VTSVIFGHVNRSCYLLTYFHASGLVRGFHVGRWTYRGVVADIVVVARPVLGRPAARRRRAAADVAVPVSQHDGRLQAPAARTTALGRRRWTLAVLLDRWRSHCAEQRRRRYCVVTAPAPRVHWRRVLPLRLLADISNTTVNMAQNLDPPSHMVPWAHPSP